jgi:hypothetical protein
LTREQGHASSSGVQIAAREAEARLPELCQTAIRSTV